MVFHMADNPLIQRNGWCAKKQGVWFDPDALLPWRERADLFRDSNLGESRLDGPPAVIVAGNAIGPSGHSRLGCVSG